MCKKKGCDMRMGSLCICCVECKCDQSCYECYYGTKYYNHMWSVPYECNSFEVRNKYVCFECKRIWKSPVSKYQANKVSNYNWVKKYNWYSITGKQLCDNKYNPTDQIKNKNTCLKKDKINAYLDVYLEKKSKCASCKNDGIHVGRNFRHCKTNKEWKELKQKYQDKKIDLYWDFHEYPREGTKEAFVKFENKCKQIEEQKKKDLEQYNIPILQTAPIFLR